MKKLIAIAFLILPVTVNSQNTGWWLYPSIGVDMGITLPIPLSDIPEGASGAPELHPNIGIGIEYQISDRWNLANEISYHTLSFTSSVDVRSQSYHDIYISGHTNIHVDFRFVEFPFMANYSIGEHWHLLTGGYISFLLKRDFITFLDEGIFNVSKIITDTATVFFPINPPKEYPYNENISKWDAGLILGYRYNLNHRIQFWTRVQVGVKSIFKKDFSDINYNLYMVRLNVGLSVTLFSNKQNNDSG